MDAKLFLFKAVEVSIRIVIHSELLASFNAERKSRLSSLNTLELALSSVPIRLGVSALKQAPLSSEYKAAVN